MEAEKALRWWLEESSLLQLSRGAAQDPMHVVIAELGRLIAFKGVDWDDGNRFEPAVEMLVDLRDEWDDEL